MRSSLRISPSSATLSVGIPPNLRPGLRGVSIREDDPFQGTWNVVVLGAHFAAMLAAREDRRANSDGDSAFDFVVTYDRDIIVECAQALMLRIALSEDPDQSAGRERTFRDDDWERNPAQTG
jgi:DICT domain-containing protein